MSVEFFNYEPIYNSQFWHYYKIASVIKTSKVPIPTNGWKTSPPAIRDTERERISKMGGVNIYKNWYLNKNVFRIVWFIFLTRKRISEQNGNELMIWYDIGLS